MGKRIGYAAFYATELSALADQNALLACCDRVFTDEIRRSDDQRSELAAALVALQPGDHLVVADLSVLAKSLPHLGRVITAVAERRAHLAVCRDAGEPVVLSEDAINGLLAAVAVHVALSNARALDGARSTSSKNGRPAVMDAESKRKMRKYLAEGKSQSEIAKALGLSRTSCWRYSKQLEIQVEMGTV